MLKKIFFFLPVLLIPCMAAGRNIILTGTLKNYNKTRIVLHIYHTGDITFDHCEEIVSIDLNNNTFYSKIEHIDYPHLSNLLEIGNHKIYIGFLPEDSLHLEFDCKDPDKSLRFSGTNAGKNYFIHTYLTSFYKEQSNKSLEKMKFPVYKQLKEDELKSDMSLLNQYCLQYHFDTTYYQTQKQEIIFNFYNDLSTFNKKNREEPHIEGYDTANLISNRFMINNNTYYSVLTGYLRYRYQMEKHSVMTDDFQPYYYAYNYLHGEVLENFLGYFIMFQLTYNFSEQTIDNLKTIYFDYRKNYKNKEIYRLVTQKGIDMMMIRKNE